MRLGAGLIVVVSVLLAGCSTLYENKYDFRDGWRKGEVARITPGEAILRPGYWQCTRRTTVEQRSGRQYAVVAYRQVPYRPRQHLVPVPPGLELQEGQPVYVKLDACEAAIALPQAVPG
jgi:hypothetical protein